MPTDGWRVVIYMGSATLDDRERRDTVHVTLQTSREMVPAHPFAAHSATPAKRRPAPRGGRIVETFDC
jgi:hypothetical protein